MSGFSGGAGAADAIGGGVIPAVPAIGALLAAGLFCDPEELLAPADDSELDGSPEGDGPQPNSPASSPRASSRRIP